MRASSNGAVDGCKKQRCGPHTEITYTVLWHLVGVTSALAVAVDEVGGENTGAEDSEAHEKSNAGMHAYIDSVVHSDTLLSICHKDRGTEEKNS